VAIYELMKREHFFLMSFLVGMAAGWFALCAPDSLADGWFAGQAFGASAVKMIALSMLKFNLLLSLGAICFCVPYVILVDTLSQSDNRVEEIFYTVLPEPLLAAIQSRLSNSFRPPRKFT
jgi:hypothetical protein